MIIQLEQTELDKLLVAFEDVVQINLYELQNLKEKKFKEDYQWRIYELKRMQWRLLNRPGNADPCVISAALDFLSGEIAQMEKTLLG